MLLSLHEPHGYTPVYDLKTATIPEYRFHHKSIAEMDKVNQHFNPPCYQLIEGAED